MPIDVQIQPLLESVDVFGPPDASSAYSLSGHITITLTPSRSFFERSRPEYYALESLELVFEGQSELISDVSGYSALRLCSIKRELVHGEPIKLTNDDTFNSVHTQPAKWELVFDIPLPGWLPATSLFQESHNGCQVGTQYTLFATAHLRDLGEGERFGVLGSVFCGIFRPSTFIQSARSRITLRRFYTAQHLPPDHNDHSYTFPSIPYSVKTSVRRSSSTGVNDPQVIPQEILAAIEVMAELPEHCCLEQNHIPCTLRLRPGSEFPQNAFGKTKIVGFNLDVRQHESYSSISRPSYVRQFPLPPHSQQPPREPLISPHPLKEFYELGIVAAPHEEESVLVDVDFSLLPPQSPHSSYRVANGGMFLQDKNTISFDIDLDLSEGLIREGDEVPVATKKDMLEWKRIRTTSDSPFLRVRHQISVELICQYQHDAIDGDFPLIAQEILRFKVPLHFVVPSAPLTAFPTVSSTSLVSSSSSTLQNNVNQRIPYGKHSLMKIPAYSQLFYPNGDPRYNELEYQGEPLPTYRKNETDGDINTVFESMST